MQRNDPHTADILDRYVSGFHTHVLAEPFHVSFASQNLCSLLGLGKDELVCDGRDLYAERVYPPDRERYEAFLRKPTGGGQTFSEQYRIAAGGQTLLFVNDTITTEQLDDGTIAGHSVLADITELKAQTQNLQFLSDTIPCGFLKYTCEKAPRITYINDQMLGFLRFPDKEGPAYDSLEMYKDNIFLMVPVEDRRRFSLYLDYVRRRGIPIAGEMTVLRCDGSTAHLFGWVTKHVDEQGREEFQSVCMDITERRKAERRNEAARYLNALTGVYDLILEFDFSNRTVRCLHEHDAPERRWTQDIPMDMDEAINGMVDNAVAQGDRGKVRAFLSGFRESDRHRAGGPPTIRYEALSPQGARVPCSGLFLKIGPRTGLFCCKAEPDAHDADDLKTENASLREMNENMQNLVRHFTDGLAAFEIAGDTVTPLYASDNVCRFFGYTIDEWLEVLAKRTPIGEFVARSSITRESVERLVENGEAEFDYHDLQSGSDRRIKAICTRKATDDETQYVMLYRADAEGANPPGGPSVSIRTFGFFDVFVDGSPIAFRNKKSKELFALLVDRRGGFVSSEEAIGFLWEDEPASPVTLARYRKVALRLKNTLAEYGIPDVIESVNGERRLVTDKVSCDLYDYLTGREEFSQLFKGSYLSNYSWGEITLAELTGERLQ